MDSQYSIEVYDQEQVIMAEVYYINLGANTWSGTQTYNRKNNHIINFI